MKWFKILFGKKSGKAFKKQHSVQIDYAIPYVGVRFKNLPFEPSENEVIYIEDEFNEEMNHIIKENLTLITAVFAYEGLSFEYLPKLGDYISKEDDTLHYFFPSKSNEDYAEVESLKSNFMFDYLYNPDSRTKLSAPSLIKFSCKGTNEMVIYDRWELNPRQIKNVAEYFSRYAHYMRYYIPTWTKVLYSLPSKDDEYADWMFDEETQKLISDVKINLERLRQRGVGAMVLQRLVKGDEKLSTLRISNDYRLFLSDFGEKEVVMTPLVKAVYFLFLAHPNGIKFKELADYREELMRIYYCIKGGLPLFKMLGYRKISQSITDVTDPTKNSINEKCTRIKEAFLSVIPDYLAHNYYVTGLRGEPKRVILSRDLITGENLKFLQGLQN